MKGEWKKCRDCDEQVWIVEPDEEPLCPEHYQAEHFDDDGTMDMRDDPLPGQKWFAQFDER